MLLFLSAALAAEPVNVALPWSFPNDLAWAGDTIAVAGDGGVVFYSASGELRAELPVRRGALSVELSADGTRAISTDVRGKIRWSDSGGEVLDAWRSGWWFDPGVALSPSGERALVLTSKGAALRSPDGSEVALPELYGGRYEGGFIDEDTVYGRLLGGDLGIQSPGAFAAPARALSFTGGSGVVKQAGGAFFVQGWSLPVVERVAGDQSTFFVLPGQSGQPAFAPDPAGERVAYTIRTPDNGVTVMIFNPDTGELWRPEVGRFNTIADIVWSPDGARLAVTADDRLLVVDVPTAPAAGPPQGIAVDEVGFTADGRNAWVIYATGEIWAWSLESGEGHRLGRAALSSRRIPGPLVRALPEGFLAQAGDGGLALFGLDGTRRETLLSAAPEVHEVAVAADGTIAFFGAYWALIGGGEVIPFPYAQRQTISPGGDRVAFLDLSGAVVVVDPRAGRTLARISASAILLHFLEGGQLLIVTSEGQALLWDGTEVRAASDGLLVAGSMPDTRLGAVAGQRLLTAGGGGDLLLRELPGGRWIGDVVHGWPWEYRLDYERIALHPDGRRALTVNRFGGVQLWDLEERALLGTLGSPLPVALSVAVAPDGALWAGWADRGVGPVEVSDSAALGWLEADPLDLAFSPSGGRVAVAGSDGGVRVLNRADGAVILSAKPFEFVARQVMFTSEDQLLARDDTGSVAALSVPDGAVTPLASGVVAMGLRGEDLITWSDQELAIRTGEAWTRNDVGRRAYSMSSVGAGCGSAFVVGADYAEDVAFYRFDAPDARPKAVHAPGVLPAQAMACAEGRVALVDAVGVLWVFPLEGGDALARVELGVGAFDLIAIDGDRFAAALADGRVVRYELPTDTLTTFALADPLRPAAINPPESP